jgi:hypothetical protein
MLAAEEVLSVTIRPSRNVGPSRMRIVEGEEDDTKTQKGDTEGGIGAGAAVVIGDATDHRGGETTITAIPIDRGRRGEVIGDEGNIVMIGMRGGINDTTDEVGAPRELKQLSPGGEMTESTAVQDRERTDEGAEVQNTVGKRTLRQIVTDWLMFLLSLFRTMIP